MARVCTSLNFARSTEEAFEFYKSVFGTEYAGPVMRFRDIPPHPGQPELAPGDRDLVMHVELPILGGHSLMGTDAVESMGHPLTMGNNFSLSLEPDTRADAQRLFDALAEGGKVQMPLTEMFWGALWGSLVDRFGVQWMVNCMAPKA